MRPRWLRIGNRSRMDRLEEARDVLFAARKEAELIAADPAILANYAGQWVAIQNGQVVAYAADGAELAGIANIDKFPDAVVQYVPSREEEEGILILGSDRVGESSS